MPIHTPKEKKKAKKRQGKKVPARRKSPTKRKGR